MHEETVVVEQQRNRRLLRGLLLGMLTIFGAIDIFSVLTIPGYRVPWIGYVYLVGSLLLNFRDYYRSAAALLILLVPSVVFTTSDPLKFGARSLYYFVFAEITASLLLSFRASLAVAIGSAAAIVAAGLWMPGSTGIGEVRGPLIVVTVSGVLLLITTVHRERTERDRQAALRGGVDRYRSLFNNVPVALAEQDMSAVRQLFVRIRSEGVTDLVHHLDVAPARFANLLELSKRIDGNERWAELFGPHARRGPSSWDGGSSSMALVFARVAIALMQHGHDVELESEVEVTPGVRRFVNFRITVRPGSEETWDRVLMSAVDVTEPRQAQEAVRVHEARMRAIVETSLDPIITMDHTGHVLEFNPAAERTFGYARSDAIGKPMDALIAISASGDAQRNGLERFLASGDGQVVGRRIELSAMRADGSVFPCELAMTVSTLDNPPTFTAHLRDLTERAKAEVRQAQLELQLRQAQKMEAVGQLAGGVAHDFNNSLQAVSGFLSFALDEALKNGSPDLLADLREAQAVVGRSAGLTRQLLAYSRQQTLSLQTTTLDSVLVSVLTLLRRILGEHIEVRYRPTNGLPPVRIDAGQFEQAILNLCLNARDAMPNGGTLTLSTEITSLDESRIQAHPAMSPGAHVLLTVQDTGIGIDPSALRRIFEPFFTTKEAGRGTGLGLAVVYGVVVQHRGMIEVDSKVGIGTTFRIYVPATVDVMHTPVSVPLVERRGGTETILFADDDTAIRTVVERFLRDAGYRVLSAASGIEAERVFREHAAEIALVLFDAIMPGQSGRTTYERIAPLRPNLPVIFCSGYSREILDAKWLASVGGVLVNKPIERDELLHRVREVLDSASGSNTHRPPE